VVEGPVRDPDKESFTAYHSLPIRHAMTLGELAWLFDDERGLGADLRIVPMIGWSRGDDFERTGLRWVRPSPNLPTPTAALLYPGVALLETTNVSVGRGTDRPFERIGAPWMDGTKVAEALAAAGVRGVRFTAVRFTPEASAYAGVSCGGVGVEVVDPDALEPVKLGLTVARTLWALHPTAWSLRGYGRLLANDATLEALARGDSIEAIVAPWRDGLEAFARRRVRHLLY
jgi:uncharacterized protein YbbC (DUF1343 family)